jgi:hypothetical protein
MYLCFRLINMRYAAALFVLFALAAPLRAQEATPSPDPRTATDVSTPESGELSIQYGLNVSGRLDDANPRAAYVFDGLRGEVLNITLTTTGGDLDPVLALLNNSGALVTSRDDSAGGRDVRLENVRIPQTDRYYVVVGRFGYGLGSTSGAYELTIERVGVSSASGSALRYGDTVINTINSLTPTLYYSFQAERGDIINVTMQRISGDLDTYLQIVNSEALVIADNDDVPGSGSLDASITALAIEQPGTYVIVATRFGQAAGESAGAFSLTLEESADSGMGNSAQTALPISIGTTIEGELTNERPAQYYRFEARANDIVSVRMERLAGGLDSFLALADAQFVELTTNDDMQGSQNSSINEFLIPADGTYYVIATRFQRDQGTTTGSYRLSLTGGGNVFAGIPEGIPRLTYGTTVTGNIDDTFPIALFAFYGRGGDVITLSMNRGDGNLDPSLSILDANQQPLVSNDDAGDGTQNARIDRFVLPVTGVYYVQASRFSGATGDTGTRGSYILVLAQRFD